MKLEAEEVEVEVEVKVEVEVNVEVEVEVEVEAEVELAPELLFRLTSVPFELADGVNLLGGVGDASGIVVLQHVGLGHGHSVVARPVFKDLGHLLLLTRHLRVQ